MLEAMPVGDGGYRALSGKAKLRNVTPEGKPTRTKIDLFPEYIRYLPPKKREVWDLAGRVLRSKELGKAFVERLSPRPKPRSAGDFRGRRYYPRPILTRGASRAYLQHSPTTPRNPPPHC